MKPCPVAEELLGPVLRVAMPRACLVDAEVYTLAALRYLDRNPVRACLVEDPATYPWSSCAAYTLGTPNRLITFHPSYLALSLYPKVRQRHYRTMGEENGDKSNNCSIYVTPSTLC